MTKDAKWALKIFICFFSVFIIVDIAYIIIAEKTWRGVAIKDGYQKGLKYNESLEKVKKQAALGWNLQIKYLAESNQKGDLQIVLKDSNGAVINDANVTSKIKRPVQEGFDFELSLKFDERNSTYQSAIQFPLKGQWDVEIVAKKGEDVMQEVKRLVIQ